ncbi:MAG: hypothetical protein HYS15_01405 [Candidatus Spechtbacteria bacterium]|nr:hypothetical protein [Candidatus Spechtbacteria bacterium]
MNIKDIRAGMLVETTCSVTEGPFGLYIPGATVGIVTSVRPNLDVMVEFEVGETLVSRPISCHPAHLIPVASKEGA